jgi:DNA-binding response OmpR family regulator
MACPCDKDLDLNSQKRILSLLLAEDNDALRETLLSFFSAQGFRVYPAGTGTEAIDIALEKKISFSIMDVNMPGLDGIEAFKLISRKIGRKPCIFMSADASQEVMLKALNAGGFTFLSKPIQMELMRLSVDRLISKFFLEGKM